MGKGAKVNDDEKDGARQAWATPQALFEGISVDAQGFTVDACATAENAKLSRFWTPEQNGLAQAWEGERVFCNPPYNDIEPWIARGYVAAIADATSLSVFLLPARTGTAWFARYALRGLVDFFRGRIAFEIAGSMRVQLLAASEEARVLGDAKLAKSLGRSAEGAQNAEDSILVTFSQEHIIVGSGMGSIGCLRDAVTGQPIVLPELLEKSSTTGHPCGPCKLCGEDGSGVRVHSSLTNSSVHEDCAEQVREHFLTMDPEQRSEARRMLLAS